MSNSASQACRSAAGWASLSCKYYRYQRLYRYYKYARYLVICAGDLRGGEAAGRAGAQHLRERGGGEPGVPQHRAVHSLGEAQLARVDVHLTTFQHSDSEILVSSPALHLYDLGLPGPVVEAVLGQGSEWAQPGAER